MAAVEKSLHGTSTVVLVLGWEATFDEIGFSDEM
jgi:hypothetical protein